MLATLKQYASIPAQGTLFRHTHVLVAMPRSPKVPGDCPGYKVLESLLSRRRMKAAELGKSPLSGNTAGGTLVAWVMFDTGKPSFDNQASMRTALQLLLGEHPKDLAIVVLGAAEERRYAAEMAAFCAWANGVRLPERKKKSAGDSLRSISLFGHVAVDHLQAVRAVAEGNVACRELTVLPPNELTPETYRGRILVLAREHGWKHDEYDFKRLKKMGAGAFCAVAQGSSKDDAAIVHVCYSHPQAKKRIALIGKGICFDTGGHNLKPARYMQGMHQDMNGSAVVLGIMTALSRMKAVVQVDGWLALAQNHLSPMAYKQNDVVKALNGTTIEIMHTDAEGRMVLADTLTLAARAKPELMIDFATLTGSMHVALGNRYSGIFATSDELASRGVACGRETGERVCAFPADADYDEALESKIADVIQCTLDGDADHILATRFLSRFTDKRPWIHVDLAAHSCKGGLGAIASDVTGFGVAWGCAMAREVANSREEDWGSKTTR